MPDLEQELGVPLPESFLALYTRPTSLFLEAVHGSDWGYPAILDFRSIVIEHLEEIGYPNFLQQDDVVFLHHQGYQFFYLKGCHSNANPEVWYFCEPDTHRKDAHTFAIWYASTAGEDYITELYQ